MKTNDGMYRNAGRNAPGLRRTAEERAETPRREAGEFRRKEEEKSERQPNEIIHFQMQNRTIRIQNECLHAILRAE